MSLLVLSAGTDPALLNSRNAVLLHLGCTLRSVRSASEVIRELFDGDFDLVVLCHTIPARDREKVVEAARHCRPSTPVIVVASYWDESHMDGAEKVPPEPEAFAEAVRRHFPRGSRS